MVHLHSECSRLFSQQSAVLHRHQRPAANSAPVPGPVVAFKLLALRGKVSEVERKMGIAYA